MSVFKVTPHYNNSL